MTWLLTQTGKRLDYKNPMLRDIDLDDIFYSLARIPRYLGHGDIFYSVAEHSCLVSDWIYRITEDPSHAMIALFHDAPEAYICDLPKPLKEVLYDNESYFKLESKLLDLIFYKANITLKNATITNEIKAGDQRILLDERNVLFSRHKHIWEMTVRPLGVKVTGWTSDIARYNMEYRYNLLNRIMKSFGRDEEALHHYESAIAGTYLGRLSASSRRDGEVARDPAEPDAGV